MEVVSSITPLLTVLVSAVGACLILATGERNRNLRESWTIIAAVIKFALVVSMVPLVLEGKVIEFTFINLAPGLPLQLKVDPFGMLFALLASTLWIATSFYSIGYMRGLNEHAQTRYFFCFAVCLSATMGIAFAGNLITFFIFYEILTVATYPLVMHMETEEAYLGSRKYLVYTLIAGVVLLFALAVIYSMTGTLDFTPGGFLAGHGIHTGLLIFLFVLLIMGCGVKAGIMPLHEWLPTAMVAPTPVSALLHAVAVVKAGVFGTLRIILYVFGPILLHDLGVWLILAYVVSFTIIVSAMLALAQDNFKRRLAFSTVNNLAIIILGAIILTSNSITGGMLHLVNHGFMKIALFFVAGAVFVKTHKKNVSDLDGLGRQMPLTFGAFTICALGLAGVPPACGFISKWFLCLGFLEAKEIFFLIVLLTSAMLDIAFFGPIIYKAFFAKPKPDVSPHFDEAPMLMVIPILCATAISVMLCVSPNAFVHVFDIARMAARSILGAG
ncbi:MAG: monovalent cation/H+ antiporter subunit D family protein [Desulfobacteraceae bacterium]|nr:monovalent cation/H+ antiporter subunit D family protein [Desulfobacteraceae bacterium]